MVVCIRASGRGFGEKRLHWIKPLHEGWSGSVREEVRRSSPKLLNRPSPASLADSGMRWLLFDGRLGFEVYGKVSGPPCTPPPYSCLHGLTACRTMAIPSAAIYMLGYEHLVTLISPYFTGSTDPLVNTSSLHRRTSSGVTASLTPAPLIAGSLARTLSATIISPIEMFRTRLQALPTGE